MEQLTKKYIFMQKLKGERIVIWSACYSDDVHSNTWMDDMDLLVECGCATELGEDNHRTLLHDIVVIYPNARNHSMDKGTLLSGPLRNGAYDHDKVSETIGY